MQRRTLGAFVVLAGVLVACGGSGASSQGARGDTAARPPATQAAVTIPFTTTATVATTEAAVATTTPDVMGSDSSSVSVSRSDPGLVDDQFSGDSGSSFCDVVRQFDESSPLDTAFGNSTTPEATKASWDAVMQAFDSLRATAPDEIAADVAVATKFIDAMDRIFVDNKYDMVEIGIDLEADPELAGLSEVSPEADAASRRLEAYGIQVCGLAP